MSNTKRTQTKKGNRSWKPASLTNVMGQEKGFHYRWVSKAGNAVQKRLQEGYEVVSKALGSKASHDKRDHIEERGDRDWETHL